MYLQTIALAEDRVARLALERRRPGPVGRIPSERAAMTRDLRRLLARALLAVSAASGAAVRLLDACVADDLARRTAVRHGA